MTAFYMLTELFRSLFSLWALLLCLICIFGIVLAISHRRYRLAAFSMLHFMSTYFLWQVLFDIHLVGGTNQIAAVSRKLGSLPWLCWLAAFFVLTAAAVILFLVILRCGKRSITPAAVKRLLDQMPCGVCCWRDSGRVLFSNICMNRLCVSLTGGHLCNGNHFHDKIKDEILTVDGRVWRFVCRDIAFGGETLHEMIASDITAEYAKTQALEQDKAELSRLKGELQAYSMRIEDTVRQQEILQAKVSIHDEMNRLMLSTMAADKTDAAALDRIFSQWEQNALFLCMQADDESADKKEAERLNDLAKSLGIRLIWQAELPSAMTEKQRALFFTAAQEAVINAAKHAGATSLDISFTQSAQALICDFVNDGIIPSEDVRFVGGLKNLALLAGEQSACVVAKCAERFTLSLRFQKKFVKISRSADALLQYKK